MLRSDLATRCRLGAGDKHLGRAKRKRSLTCGSAGGPEVAPHSEIFRLTRSPRQILRSRVVQPDVGGVISPPAQYVGAPSTAMEETLYPHLVSM